MNVARGTVVDRYTVEHVLGRGGMAVVYQVRHNQLDTVHAMKVLSVQFDAVGQRLLTEGRVQGRLRHPNVVAVTDVVTVGGLLGLVMEFVDGPSLEWFLRRHRPNLAQADDLAMGILRGVAEAHACGLIHRDLKPSNILLATRDGLVPKITDFGLAKILTGSVRGKNTTSPGARLGTPGYMAPEQISDSSSVDARADVFSLGAILYELVTGERAFQRSNIADTFEAIHACDYRPLGEVAPDLPGRMVDAIEGALVVDREARIGDVATLLARWTGVEEDDDRSGPWDVALLEQMRSGGWGEPVMGDEPGEASLSDTMVEPVGADPMVSDAFPTAETRATAPPPKARQSRPQPKIAAEWVGLAVALLVLAVAVWQPWHEPHSEQDAPVISPEAAVQERFEAAWNDLLQGRLDEARGGALEVADFVAGDARPHLVAHAARVIELRGSRDRTALEAAALRTGPGAELVKILLDPEQDHRRELGRHLERHPDDHLAKVLYLAAADWPDKRPQLAAVQGAVKAHEHNLLWWYLHASVFAEAGRWVEAEQTARAGLQVHVDAPLLRLALGRIRLARGDFEEAERHLRGVPLEGGRALWCGMADALDRGERSGCDDLGEEAQERRVRTQAEVLLGRGQVDRARDAVAEVAMPSYDPALPALQTMLESEHLESTLLGLAFEQPERSCARDWYEAVGDDAGPAVFRTLLDRDDCVHVGWRGYLLHDARKRSGQ